MFGRISYCLGILILILLICPSANGGQIIQIDNIGVDAETFEKAEAKAKKEAIDRTIKIIGNTRLPDQVVEKFRAQSESLVTVTSVSNREKQGDLYSPIFFCEVDRARLNEMLADYYETVLNQLGRPRINIGVVLRNLPDEFAGKRAEFLDLINNELETYYTRQGFIISDNPSQMAQKLNQEDPKKVREAFVRYSTNVNYLLAGDIDLSGGITEKNYGRVFRASAGITLRFYSVASQDHVSFSRDVSGLGPTKEKSIIKAMKNAAKVISEKVAMNMIIKDWQQKIEEGFTYSLQFCAFSDKRWIGTLIDELEKKGQFISKDRGDNVTQIRKFHANPGEFIFPSADFENFLDNLEGFEKVKYGLYIHNDQLFFVFGDDGQCFEYTQYEKAF